MSRLDGALLTAAILCAMSAGCDTGGSGVAVPRPPAYPRLAVVDTLYAGAADVPVHFEVNVQAVAEVPRRGWLNVSYPQFGATIYISFTDVGNLSELETVLANRRERMDLNRGGAVAVTTNYRGVAAGAFSGELQVMRENVALPLQFIATDGRVVVNGAVAFHDVAAGAPVDSVAPAVEAVRRDIEHAILTLRR